MAKNAKNCRLSGCPIAFTLDVLGDKWSLLIIRDLIFKGKKYYGEFMESDEKIASNILADRLKRLEAGGIVTKSVDLDNQKKIVYRITQKGEELIPMLVEIIRWGAKYDPNTAAPKEVIKMIESDPKAFIKQLKMSLKGRR